MPDERNGFLQVSSTAAKKKVYTSQNPIQEFSSLALSCETITFQDAFSALSMHKPNCTIWNKHLLVRFGYLLNFAHISKRCRLMPESHRTFQRVADTGEDRRQPWHVISHLSKEMLTRTLPYLSKSCRSSSQPPATSHVTRLSLNWYLSCTCPPVAWYLPLTFPLICLTRRVSLCCLSRLRHLGTECHLGVHQRAWYQHAWTPISIFYRN